MAESLDMLMERASEALSRMDYLTAEAQCLEALAAARAGGDWAYYGRILLPLQEARRQRRMIAAEGVIRLGTSDLSAPVEAWLDRAAAGCIAVTHPFTAEHARALHERARQNRQHVEVLFADCPAEAATWSLRSFEGPAVSTPFAAPPGSWIDRWIEASADEGDRQAAEAARPSGDVPASTAATAADWFLDACEALGDAALAQYAPPGQTVSPAELEPLLRVAPDHELLHQRLGAAARAARGG